MKKYIATKLDPDDFREFSIKAAEAGISRSALLKKLAVAAIRRQARKPQKKGVAA